MFSHEAKALFCDMRSLAFFVNLLEILFISLMLKKNCKEIVEKNPEENYVSAHVFMLNTKFISDISISNAWQTTTNLKSHPHEEIFKTAFPDWLLKQKKHTTHEDKPIVSSSFRVLF